MVAITFLKIVKVEKFSQSRYNDPTTTTKPYTMLCENRKMCVVLSCIIYITEAFKMYI